jgi:hypothetical protein
MSNDNIMDFCGRHFLSTKIEASYTNVDAGWGRGSFNVVDKEPTVIIEMTKSALLRLVAIEEEYNSMHQTMSEHPTVKDAYNKYVTLLKLVSQ